MEREILLSGMGGQGVQLASKSLATAAIKEGRNALMFGSYGGTMRGGDTDATIVIGTDRLITPPVIDHAWAGIAMHPMGWPGMRAKLRPGGLVLVNTGVFKEPVSYDGTILELDAAGLSTDGRHALKPARWWLWAPSSPRRRASYRWMRFARSQRKCCRRIAVNLPTPIVRR